MVKGALCPELASLPWTLGIDAIFELPDVRKKFPSRRRVFCYQADFPADRISRRFAEVGRELNSASCKSEYFSTWWTPLLVGI